MMEEPSTGAKWGLAAVLGCGACCGGLAGTVAWAGATALVAPVAVGAVAVVGAGVGAAAWWRRRQRAAADTGADADDAAGATGRTETSR